MKCDTLTKKACGLVLVAIFTVAAGLSTATAQVGRAQLNLAQFLTAEEPEGCTSIQVGRLASADGSVITCHSCDGNYRTWLNIVPSRDNSPGTMKQIIWGKLHTETAWETRRTTVKGEIPEAEHTYAYMNVGYPCMNEKGLAIGETTIGGNSLLRNQEGLFLIEELQMLTLERCTTAREAIQLIGELVKEYGYGDNGECLTFADAKEVWHFEIMGGGPFEVGAVWAAVRIPDEHVGVSANIPRIGELDLDDPDHYMASDNVLSLAEELDLWDPSSGETFKFWKAYGRRDREGNTSRPFSTREFFILSTLAPDLNLSMDMEKLPFSVKPNRKISVREVMRYYRETYEGTALDMSKNLKVSTRRFDRRTGERIEGEPVTSPIVNNWTVSRDMGSLLNTLVPGTVQSQRTIAISGCSYSQVIQCRDWLPPEIGTVAWFSFDNPGQSPRIPIFAGTLSLPPSFEICGQHRYREDSACWWFRRANRLAMIKWGATRDILEGAVADFEEKAFMELPSVEKIYMDLYQEDPDKARDYITQYSNDFAHAAMSKWWQLGNRFFEMFARGW